MANLIYKGSKASLPAERNATSFYLCEDTRELYFGANLYTEAVRFYTTAEGKPTTPAQGVLYVNTDTGAGDAWNGTAWKNVIKGCSTTIGDSADDTTVPTTKATKEYVDTKVADVIAGSIDGLGDLASKDEVTEAELGTDLAAKINGKADQTDVDTLEGKVDTLVGEDANKSARTIASEEVAKIVAGADESYDTLKEISDWISSHTTDAASMNSAILALQAIVDGIGDTESGEKATVVAYVTDAIAALNIGDYAKAADLTALAARVTTAEGKLDTLTGEETVDGSVKKALKDAKDYADGLNTAMDTRVQAVEGKAHEHENKTVLDGINATKVAAWDVAEQNAKDYADDKDTAMNTRVTAVETALTVGTF